VSKSIRALIAGCSVIVKPAIEGALQTFRLAEAFADVGLPEGVISILPGGAEAGQQLVEHPAVDMITFTGSTDGGRRIAESCGRQLKRTILELGGKSAALVLDDADLDSVMPWLIGGAFGNAGQVCIALTRVVAPRDRYDEVVNRLAESAASLRPGPPLDPSTTVGSLISRRQYERVAGYVDAARAAGARVVTGGGRPPDSTAGWFYAPTVLADVRNDMQVAREEVFGPVVVVIPHDGDDDAVRIANDSPFGLHGAVFSVDVDRALAVAGRIRSGTAAVNGYGILSSSPFGGVKSSGWGREGGPESIAEFTELRALTLDAATAARCAVTSERDFQPAN
jgi:betaine-aldehyde dehydrogenase